MVNLFASIIQSEELPLDVAADIAETCIGKGKGAEVIFVCVCVCVRVCVCVLCVCCRYC